MNIARQWHTLLACPHHYVCLRAQEGRDAICAHEAYPEARPASAAGLERCQGRGGADRDLILPREQLLIASVFRDQHGELVLARWAALGTFDPQDVELANQVGEDDRASRGMRGTFDERGRPSFLGRPC